MLFEYQLSGAVPANVVTLWSNTSLQPLAAGNLTPFSYSVMSELASRAWYVHYDRLGFEPTPRTRLVRQYKGRAYLNRSLSAQLDAAHAGVEPAHVQINGQDHSLATWEKPGLLGGFKLGRGQKKIDATLLSYHEEAESITERARNWFIKTQELRWSQAEVLQVMEEIERVGVDGMALYLTARHNLEWLYTHLLQDLTQQMTRDQGLVLINNALCDMQGLVETEMADTIHALGEKLSDQEQLDWLKEQAPTEWQEGPPGKQANDQFFEFLSRYGHRTRQEGEMMHPRWREDPSMVFRSLLMEIEHPAAHPSKLPASGNRQKLVDGLSAAQQKHGRAKIEKMRQLHHLQSRALDALAYIWAGTRRWALAAAEEAMVDQRLEQAEDVFFFELEEIKQMMTGEWNVSARDEIRATAEARRAEYLELDAEDAPPALIGDVEAVALNTTLPGVSGHAAGPLRRWDESSKHSCHEAVLGTTVLDSGWALILPSVSGFVSQSNTPMDPFIAATRAWHRPVIIGLGAGYEELVEGAHTILDVGISEVKVEQ